MEVELNKAEQILVRHIAEERYKSARGIKAVPTVYGKETPFFRELNSFGGELAFCKLFNVYPDTKPEYNKKEKKSDCILPDKRMIDIKTTTEEKGRLLVKIVKGKDYCKWFGLMTGTLPKYKYIGIISSEHVLLEHKIDKKMPEPCYAVTQMEIFLKGEVL